MGCSFCRGIAKEDIVFKTQFWTVFLADDQRYLGRSIVSLNRHCPDLIELKNEEWKDFIEVVKILENTLRKAFDAKMFNWSCLMNDAYQEKEPQPHVHWHFRPRYDKKIEFNGEIFEDKEFGHHYNNTEKRKISKETRDALIKEFKKIDNYEENKQSQGLPKMREHEYGG